MKRALLLLMLSAFLQVGNLSAAGTDLLGTWATGPLTIVFKASGIYTWKDSRATLDGEYKVEGAFLTMIYEGKASQYLYRVQDGTLRLTDSTGNAIELQRQESPAAAAANLDQLYGEWRGRHADIQLAIYRSGQYVFGKSAGAFQADEARIKFVDTQSGAETTYEYKFFDGELRLRDATGNVLAFARTGPAPDSAPAGNPRLIGSWFCRRYNMAIVFEAGGDYRFGPDTGSYKADAARIQFTSAKSGKTSVYGYQFAGDELRLRDPQGNELKLVRK